MMSLDSDDQVAEEDRVAWLHDNGKISFAVNKDYKITAHTSISYADNKVHDFEFMCLEDSGSQMFVDDKLMGENKEPCFSKLSDKQMIGIGYTKTHASTKFTGEMAGIYYGSF